jgi:signal transduction histidine kinase
VTCSAAVEDDDAVLVVQDTGMGIPEAEQESLGTPFFRASNAVRREIQGSGLGLSIVRTVVRQHHGQLELESAEGVGTTVTVRIPLLRSGAPAAAARTRRAVP